MKRAAWHPIAFVVACAAVASGALAKPGRKPKADAGAQAATGDAGPSTAAAPADPSATPSPGPSAAMPTAPTAPTVSGSVGGCVETVPAGAARPILRETFPARGLSGYESTLRIVVEHGRGETVLPRGLELQSESESAKALKEAGFVLPDQDGGAAARLSPGSVDATHPDRTSTILDLPLLALPAEPGRHTLTLPPLPVAVARANGEIATVCTKPHTLVVDEPTASTPNAQPKPNPPARAQREEWTSMRQAVIVAAFALLAGVLLTLLVRWWRARPKQLPPPPPPRPPWEVALEKLDEVRHAGLLAVGRSQEYFDRVNDAVREYLGARYGFDGLESTTDEIREGLRHAPLDRRAMATIIEFLQECDLVKFANVTPTNEECETTFRSAERIVRTTMPVGPGDIPAGPNRSADPAAPPRASDGPPGPPSPSETPPGAPPAPPPATGAGP
jgi:hypothetical protein